MSPPCAEPKHVLTVVMCRTAVHVRLCSHKGHFHIWKTYYCRRLDYTSSVNAVIVLEYHGVGLEIFHQCCT